MHQVCSADCRVSKHQGLQGSKFNAGLKGFIEVIVNNMSNNLISRWQSPTASCQPIHEVNDHQIQLSWLSTSSVKSSSQRSSQQASHQVKCPSNCPLDVKSVPSVDGDSHCNLNLSAVHWFLLHQSHSVFTGWGIKSTSHHIK